MEPLEELNKMIDIFNTVQERWPALNEEINKVQAQMTDMEHYIENNNFNACEGYTACKIYQELRRYRRKLKNERDLLEPFHSFIKDHAKLSIDLYKIRTAMEKSNEIHKNWVYRPRAEGVDKIDTGN